MSDRMTPIPFPKLMQQVLCEHESGSVFGVRTPYVAAADKRLDLFAEHLETPIGPAAGPQTQLAQNIIAAYYAGARFFELKTVQTLDGEDLPVSKPCILANDECYNVEWSTELTVPQAFDEYVKAWFALKLISRMYGLGRPDGFVFNMSVGYQYEGITSEKIDTFINGMKDASDTPIWQACATWAKENLDRLPHVDAAYIDGLSPHVCTSITLSTLHGCPPHEIERIASHLIAVKGLNTFVKCNPTLLGYEFARKTLDQLGFDYVSFTDFHFLDDLQYRDAVPMCKRLLSLSAMHGVSFGLKLTNTFPVQITQSELPGEEMYMSGRALYPLTMELAHRISKTFDGQMRISFSGGADAFNVSELFDAGIWPITMATTLLKPGGYQRLRQMATLLEKHGYAPFDGVSVGKIGRLAENARADKRSQKPVKPLPMRKIPQQVPLTSCFTAPCTHGCPFGQDIPAYVQLVGEGKYAEALRVILEKNPLPFITGKLCAHRCMEKCTRNFYEESVHIRDAKLLAARRGFDAVIGTLVPKPDNGRRVAIVGGGPAGMASAFLLARQGAGVTVYEKRAKLGGIVRHIIPAFRIADYGIERDVQIMESMGVSVQTGTAAPPMRELFRQGFTDIVYAVGAQCHGTLKLAHGESLNVLDFLEAFRAERPQDLGADVVVIGGGNTAMDAARAAKRVRGVQNVRLVYRRTRRYMPADEEELTLALEDGVEFCELLAPYSLENGQLLCKRCVLGKPDASGRRSPMETEETVTLPCSTLIAAVGEQVDGAAFAAEGIAVTKRGQVQAAPETLETSVPHVYVVGDANRGPATVAEAIADAHKVAAAIAGAYAYTLPADAATTPADCMDKQGVLAVYDDARRESARCLGCSTVCECCVQVCPNRANVAIRVEGMDMPQILHLDSSCNECGNCAAFCPYDSAPYRDKLTLFGTKKEFEESANQGFLPLGGDRFLVRLDRVWTAALGDGSLPDGIERIIRAVQKHYPYLIG